MILNAQTYVPTQEEEEKEGPRLPGPHEDPRGTPGVKGPAAERAQAVGSISHLMERRYRLRANEDFQRVRNEGRTWAHPLLVLCSLPNRLPHSRFGFSVSRRVAKATVRNRVKRVMREAVRLRLPSITSGYDLIFIARAPVVGATFRDVETAIEELLSQAGLLRRPGDR